MLKRNEIEIDASSYVDPQGFLFRQDGQIYRCIRAEARELFEPLRMGYWPGVRQWLLENAATRITDDALSDR